MTEKERENYLIFLGIHAKCTARQTYSSYHNTQTFTKIRFYRNTNCMNFTSDEYIFFEYRQSKDYKKLDLNSIFMHGYEILFCIEFNAS